MGNIQFGSRTISLSSEALQQIWGHAEAVFLDTAVAAAEAAAAAAEAAAAAAEAAVNTRATSLDTAVAAVDTAIDTRFPRVNTPQIVAVVANSDTYVDILQISGGSGYLLGAGAVGIGNDSGHYMEVIMDTVTLITELLALSGPAGSSAANTINGPLYCADSLLVKGRNYTASNAVHFVVSYISASPLVEKLDEYEEFENTSDNLYTYVVSKWLNAEGKTVTIRALKETVPHVPAPPPGPTRTEEILAIVEEIRGKLA